MAWPSLTCFYWLKANYHKLRNENTLSFPFKFYYALLIVACNLNIITHIITRKYPIITLELFLSCLLIYHIKRLIYFYQISESSKLLIPNLCLICYIVQTKTEHHKDFSNQFSKLDSWSIVNDVSINYVTASCSSNFLASWCSVKNLIHLIKLFISRLS